MEEIIRGVKTKIYFYIFFLIIIVCASVFFVFQTSKNFEHVQQIKNIGRNVHVLQESMTDFKTRITHIRKTGEILSNVCYSDMQGLREVLLRELEGMGMSVLDISLKERRNDAESAFPGKGNIIEVTVSGLLQADKIPAFLFAVSSRPKIWGVEKMNISPKVSAVDFVSKLMNAHQRGEKEYIETLMSHGQKALEDTSFNMMAVSMSVLVVVR